ncbi:hypothetical protein D5125_17060 [Magnetovirga frankeli]|uniref:hypothetical protein n=1 Tax=Magnetovirga frankeli TaxID=947516 RepID=UPI001293ED33|nr:hypothetical protein D5125_17060 [gamma proteobacterium SS-5]
MPSIILPNTVPLLIACKELNLVGMTDELAINLLLRYANDFQLPIYFIEPISGSRRNNTDQLEDKFDEDGNYLRTMTDGKSETYNYGIIKRLLSGYCTTSDCKEITVNSFLVNDEECFPLDYTDMWLEPVQLPTQCFYLLPEEICAFKNTMKLKSNNISQMSPLATFNQNPGEITDQINQEQSQTPKINGLKVFCGMKNLSFSDIKILIDVENKILHIKGMGKQESVPYSALGLTTKNGITPNSQGKLFFKIINEEYNPNKRRKGEKSAFDRLSSNLKKAFNTKDQPFHTSTHRPRFEYNFIKDTHAKKQTKHSSADDRTDSKSITSQETTDPSELVEFGPSRYYKSKRIDELSAEELIEFYDQQVQFERN